MKERLLVIGSTRAAALQTLLGTQYELLQAADRSRIPALLQEQPAAILADSTAFDTLIAEGTSDLPVIAVTDSASREEESRLLELGAAEILDLSRPAALLLRRLRSAITLHDRCEGTPIQEGLRLSLERHQIIMEQTNDIIFELDFSADTLSCSPKWKERFGYPHIVHQAASQILNNSHIHPDDIPSLAEKLEQLRRGIRYLETEVRISNVSGQYTWSRLRATSQQDQTGKTIKLVGVIIDIDQEKRSSQALLDEAARDPLTKLYNRNASRRQIEDYLASRPDGEQAALLVIDLDNFKDVNDRYGHMYGDAILVQASAEISRFFRGNDIISRIGGDEFLVFMKNIPGRTLVENRCRDLIAAIQRLYHRQEQDLSPLSCSIGTALIPEHGTSFQELFQRADRALYSAKVQNKGSFVFYDLENGTPFPYLAPAAREDTAEETADFVVGAKLIRYVFDRLCESGDVESTVQAVLELAGKQVNAGRAYIYESDPENSACVKTFEWCNTNTASQPRRPDQLRFEGALVNYQDFFNEWGIFYCPDIITLPVPLRTALAEQGIKSLLQCSIRDNGEFRGFVGFDECLDHRLWTQEQIDLLTLLSQMLSLFLLKNRAQHPLPGEST